MDSKRRQEIISEIERLKKVASKPNCQVKEALEQRIVSLRKELGLKE